MKKINIKYLNSKELSFDASIAGIKELSKHFPMVMEIAYSTYTIEEAIQGILEYLNHHHTEAYLSESNQIVNKNDNLEKGLKGDWQKEGYNLEHKNVPGQTSHRINAYDKQGNRVGSLPFHEHQDGSLRVSPGAMVFVNDADRRKGVASAMYSFAENKLGKKFKKGNTTPAGSTLWSQPNRPFGKSDDENLKKHTANRKYDVPYLAGYSKDGKTIYIDRRLPPTLKLKNGKTVHVDQFLMVHEATEKNLMDKLGYDYLKAHHLALQSERKAVQDAGIPWDEYDSFMQHWIRETAKSYQQIPPDIDLKPEHDTHDNRMMSKINHLDKAIDPQDWNRFTSTNSDENLADPTMHAKEKPAEKIHPEYVKFLNDNNPTRSIRGTYGIYPKVVHQLNDGHTYMIKQYSPTENDSPLAGWAAMTTHGLYHAAGLGNHIEDISTHIHDNSPITVHKFKPGMNHVSDNVHYNNTYDNTTLHKISMMDYLTDNHDRHSGNLMVNLNDPKDILAIDHGLSFEYRGDETYGGNYIDRGAMEAANMDADFLKNPSQINDLKQWWLQNKNKIGEEFSKHLESINKPQLKAKLAREFLERHEKLTNWSQDNSSDLWGDSSDPWWHHKYSEIPSRPLVSRDSNLEDIMDRFHKFKTTEKRRA
jgi:hypothetical protein